MGVTEKYFGHQDKEVHGDFLTWPGTADGFPILGHFQGDLKQEEFENLQLGSVFHWGVFCTWNADEMERYQIIQDYIANGHFYKKHRADVYDPDNKGWRIFLEWVQIYGLPPRNSDAIAAHANRPAQTATIPIHRQGAG